MALPTEIEVALLKFQPDLQKEKLTRLNALYKISSGELHDEITRGDLGLMFDQLMCLAKQFGPRVAPMRVT